jgi:hypothetical protein
MQLALGKNPASSVFSTARCHYDNELIGEVYSIARAMVHSFFSVTRKIIIITLVLRPMQTKCEREQGFMRIQGSIVTRLAGLNA